MIDRNFWKNSRRLYIGEFPQFKCPYCGNSTLDQAEKLSRVANKAHECEEYGRGERAISTFMLQCTRIRCKGVVMVVGDGTANILNHDDIDGTTEYSIFHPRYFLPTIPIFPLPTQISQQVRNVINSAFALFWSDLDSCANRIRTAIELVLDDLGAAKGKKKLLGHPKKPTGKLVLFKSLGARIDHFKAKNKTIAELLHANRIIGNAGSHKGTITIDDILDAFEILHHTVILIYEKKSNKAVLIAKEITAKNNPRSQK